MNFDKQLDVFSRNLSEIRRNGRYPTRHSLKSFGLGSPRFRPSKRRLHNITLSTLITIANS